MYQYVAGAAGAVVLLTAFTGGNLPLMASSQVDMYEAKSVWNDNLDEVPLSAKTKLDGKFNIHVEGDISNFQDPEYPVGVEFDNGRILDIEEGGFEDPRALVRTDAETIEEVAESDDYKKAAWDAYNSNDVEFIVNPSTEEATNPASSSSGDKSIIDKADDFLYLVLN